MKILDRELLVKRRKLSAGRPDESLLYRLIVAEDDSVMPRRGQPPLSPREIATVRRWIAGGAADFPKDVEGTAETGDENPRTGSTEYVLAQILSHVRQTPGRDRPWIRYFSINHLLTGGATR